MSIAGTGGSHGMGAEQPLGFRPGFRGDVIKRQGNGFTQTFTVRKISDGVGVERTFPLFSPNIDNILLNKTGKVRRAKLYYLRDRVGKATRLRERKKGIDTVGQAKAAAANAAGSKISRISPREGLAFLISAMSA